MQGCGQLDVVLHQVDEVEKIFEQVKALCNYELKDHCHGDNELFYFPDCMRQRRDAG